MSEYFERILNVQTGEVTIRPYTQEETDAQNQPTPVNRELLRPLTRRQLFIALAAEGHLTEQDAEDAAAGNAIPASIAAVLDTLPTAERIAARITFRSFTQAFRLDPMVPVILLASPNPPDEAALDTMWMTYVNV